MKTEITQQLLEKYTKFQIDKLRNHAPIMKHCNECGQVFDAKSYVFRPTAIYERENEFCSQLCLEHGRGKKNRIHFRSQFICEFCHNTFTPKNKNKVHQKYCNHNCYTNSLKGKSRPEVQNWIHKINPPKGSISNSEIKWLEQFELTHTQYLISINDKTYRVDGFNQKTNTIYEFLGSFWHGNPEIYNHNEINPVCKKSYKELYDNTIHRLTTFESAGYNVMYEWSSR
jgi:hypothetical protein